MAPELYYQATESRTKFESAEPDPESVGLDDFHRKTEERVASFVEGPEGILVMGAAAGVGKTHALRRMSDREGFDYIDLQGVGMQRLARKEVEAATSERSGTKVLVMDEGICGFIGEDVDVRREQINAVLQECMERYPHIVILGGGAEFTPEEQTELIAETLPGGINIETHPIALRNLNTRQTADLAQRCRIGTHQREREDERQDEFLSRELAEIIGSAHTQYFRLLRGILRMSEILEENGCEKENLRDIEIALWDKMMPKDVFRRAWEIQEALIDSKSEAINALVNDARS